MASSARAVTSAECATSRALRVRDNFQGWGNRVGWWLTASALGRALGRPVVFTGWHGAPKWQGGRNYDYAEVRRVVQFPAVLRFIEDLTADRSATASLPRHKWEELFNGLDAEEIPYHPKPYGALSSKRTDVSSCARMQAGTPSTPRRARLLSPSRRVRPLCLDCTVNDYVPEAAWQMVKDWGPRHLFRWSGCIERTRFLREYRVVQQQLRPRIPLCNPTRRSYLTVHVRGADNGRDGTGSRPVAVAAGERVEDVPSNETLHALASISARRLSPWGQCNACNVCNV